MVVAGDRVLALGDRDALAQAWSTDNRVLDLAGRALIPGLTDSHLHLLSYGQVLDQAQLAGVTSIAALVEAVARRAAALGPDEWVLGRGWDQDLFVDARYPTRDDLDQAVGGRPALLVRGCGHCSVVSSRALMLAGIGPGTPDPAGGLIERDASGRPTGVLHEKAAGLIRQIIPPPDHAALKRALGRALSLALSRGLVACHPDDVRSGGSFETVWRLYRELLPGLGGPRIRMDVSDFQLEELVRRGIQSGAGDGMLAVGAVKTFVDGSLGARSAALTRPYADGGGSGIIVQERGQFMRTVREAHRHGLQVAVHAIGDLAIDWALDAIEAAQEEYPAAASLRHRVVHAQITRPDQFDRFVRLGAVAEIQPKFVGTDKLWVESRVGPERARHSYNWATMLRRGVACAGGSDGPVEPLDPLFGIHAAVTRQGADGTPAGGWLPEQRLSVDQALRVFSTGGAYAAGVESWRGRLSPGYAADFVLLDRSPDEVAPEAIRDLKVLSTFVDGRCVFGPGF
jgi:predicted amidohydrolase YtcJ